MFRNLNVVLRAQTGTFTQRMMGAGAVVDRFGKNLDKSDKSLSRFSANLAKGLVGALVVVAAGLGAVITGAASFEKRMRNVNSISKLSEKGLSDLSQEVLNLSKNLPQSANDLAEGLYDVASSGFQGARGLTVLKAAAEAASAGLSTTATSGRALTAVLNAYGRGAEDAGDVSDVLFQTVNLGVVTFDELASSVGDWVGAAAAAKVPIEDASAALAAMTLAGINANEAGTSLNRMMQDIIQPSEALESTLKGLGYESGAQALATDGLYTVMEKLRGVTGGNITALLQLFPEIRAARGALALTSAEGANYARTQEGIADATTRAGATQKALKEQMKGLSAQVGIAMNRIKAWGVEVGLRLIPATKDALKWLQGLAQEVGKRLGPTLAHLAVIGRNVQQMLKAIWEVSKPVVGVFAAIAGSAILKMLESTAKALATVSTFLAENEAVVKTLAVTLLATLLPSLAAFVAMLGKAALYRVSFEALRLQEALQGIGKGARGASTGWKGLMAAATSTVGLAAAGAAIGGLMYAWQKAKKQAQEYAEAVAEGASTGTGPKDSAAQAKALSEAAEEASRELEAMGNAFGVPVQDLWKMTKLKASVVELNEASGKAADKARLYKSNLNKVIRATGMTKDETEALAKTLGIDLQAGGKAAEEAIAAMITGHEDLGKAAGLSQAALQAGVKTLDPEAQLEYATKIAEATKKWSDAFKSAYSIVNVGDLATSEEAIADARDQLVDATEALAEAELQYGADSRQAEQARRRITTATKELGESTKSAAERIKEFYTTSLKEAQAFSSNIERAMEMGLDPRVIAQLLEAGPKEAGPIVQALVADNSGALIKIVNAAEKALEDVNQRAVQFANLTAQAISASTQQLAIDLPLAMKILAESMKTGTDDTAQQIADALKIPGLDVAEVERIVAEFGILGVKAREALEAELKNPVKISVTSDAGSSTAADRHNRAAGGYDAHVARSPQILMGERSTGGESFIPHALSRRKRSTSILAQTASHFGYGLTPMANGGIIRPPGAQLASQPPVIVHSTSPQSKQTTYQFGDINGVDMQDAVRYADQKARQTALARGRTA